MKVWSSAFVVLLTSMVARPAAAQGVPELRKMFDAGQYQQVVNAAPAAKAQEDPRVAYLAALSHQKLSQTDAARQLYEQLAARGESDPWRDVGRSALALAASNGGAAVEAANQAIQHGDSLAEAHFQKGLALTMQNDFAGAAAAFDKASQLDPSWAYAHFYAGLSYSKIKRLDLMATHFQAFLNLAPDAPERAQVQSIMKSLGGGGARG